MGRTAQGEAWGGCRGGGVSHGQDCRLAAGGAGGNSWGAKGAVAGCRGWVGALFTGSEVAPGAVRHMENPSVAVGCFQGGGNPVLISVERHAQLPQALHAVGRLLH